MRGFLEEKAFGGSLGFAAVTLSVRGLLTDNVKALKKEG